MRILMLAGAATFAMNNAAGALAAEYARIVTDKGDIVIELHAAKAPVTVANFLEYVKAGHYDRTIIHRIVPGFVIQGGGYTRSFRERPTRAPISYEGDNGLKNVRGAVAMARTDDPNSATSQFFINLKDNPKLDHRVTELGPVYGYAAFATVVSGMDVVDAIGAAATGPGGPFDAEVPIVPIQIIRIDPAAAP